MKSYYRLITTICLLIISPCALAQSFYDIPDHYKFEKSIQALADVGIISGYPDGSFQPDKPILRAEAIKILIGSIKPSDSIDEIQNEIQTYPYYLGFTDIQPYDWFAPYVALSAQGGIINGYPDGTFRPGNAINLAEGAKTILEAFNIDLSYTTFDYRPLVLMNESDWFAPYVGYLFDHNLINHEKFYFPGQPMTRGEFIELLYRTKTLIENGWNTYPETPADSDEYTITIPRLNIYNLTVSFADPFDHDGSLNVLRAGLGHYLSPPGSGHKMVLFGHSSGYNWDHSPYKTILTQISLVQPGDMIFINYREKGYIYQVVQTEIRPASDMETVMQDSNTEEMALYTCWPPNGISKRYVVYAMPL